MSKLAMVKSGRDAAPALALDRDPFFVLGCSMATAAAIASIFVASYAIAWALDALGLLE